MNESLTGIKLMQSEAINIMTDIAMLKNTVAVRYLLETPSEASTKPNEV